MKGKLMLVAVMAALMAFATAPSDLRAQTTTTGTVEGTVTDPNGAVVPNASLTLSGPNLSEIYPLLGILLSPIVGAAAMALSSVSVVGNALRLRAVKL